MKQINKEVFEHKHICFAVDHYNPLGIIRSLGEEGIKPIVILCSKHPKLIIHSKYIGELHIFETIQDGFDYIVKNYGNEKKKPFVYNGSDDITLLLDKHYEEIKDYFYFTNGQGCLDKYLQKYESCLLAEKCGIRVPKEELLKVGTLPTSLKYPVITKASTSTGGAWKDQSFVCEDEEALKMAFSKINADTILVQEYIRKKNELCIDGISINAGEQVFMPYGCQYYNLKEGCYSNYMYFTPLVNDDLKKKITDIIRGAKFTGIFCIEFLIGLDDELYFLEVNYRNSGWSYAYTKAGVNLPLMFATSSVREEIDSSSIFIRSKFSAICEIEDFAQRVLTKEVSIFKWIKEVKMADALFFYDKNDPKPALYIWYYKIKEYVKKLLGLNSNN